MSDGACDRRRSPKSSGFTLNKKYYYHTMIHNKIARQSGREIYRTKCARLAVFSVAGRRTLRCLVHQKITLNGGSLGSWVDEERS